VFRYIDAKAGPGRRVRCGLWNEKRGWGVSITYSQDQFPRLGQWMHWGKREYVAALEPMTAGVEGRDQDRKRGWLRTIKAGEQVKYAYGIEIVRAKNEIL
jgi:hypothetical protein